MGLKRQVVTLYDEISEESSERLIGARVSRQLSCCFIYSYIYYNTFILQENVSKAVLLWYNFNFDDKLFLFGWARVASCL